MFFFIMDLFLACYVWLGLFTAVTSEYNTIWSSDNKNSLNIKYYSQPGVRLHRQSAMIDHHTGSGVEGECLSNCTSMLKCRALNVIKIDENSIQCEFFKRSTGVFKQEANSVFYSMDQPQCYGYCEELSYLKMCAKCSCKSLCNSKLPHYCDCTKDNVETITDCSQAIKVGQYPLTALYKYNTGHQTMPIMCQLFRFNVVEDLWITIFRRLSYKTKEFDRTREEYINGFNKPYEDYYFMGYKAIAELTKTKKWTLGVALINWSGEEEYVEYEGYKLVEKESSKVYYEAHFEKKRCRYCVIAIREDTTDPYSGSSICPEYEIFQGCFGGNNFVGHRHYIATTLLLRLTDPTSPPEPPFTQIDDRTNLGYFKGNKNTCISLQFRVNFNGSFKSKIVLFYPDGKDPFMIIHRDKYFRITAFKKERNTNQVYIKRDFWNTIEFYIFQHSNKNWYYDLYLNNIIIYRYNISPYDLSHLEKIKVQAGEDHKSYRQYTFFIRDFYINNQKIL